MVGLIGKKIGMTQLFDEAGRLTPVTVLQVIPNTVVAVKDADKSLIINAVKNFLSLGYGVCATRGTAEFLAQHGITVQTVNKVREGRPHIVDMIKNGEIALVINTSGSTGNEISDSQEIRRSALSQRVPQYTTVAGGEAISFGVKALSDTHVFSVQELHEQLKNR